MEIFYRTRSPVKATRWKILALERTAACRKDRSWYTHLIETRIHPPAPTKTRRLFKKGSWAPRGNENPFLPYRNTCMTQSGLPFSLLSTDIGTPQTRLSNGRTRSDNLGEGHTPVISNLGSPWVLKRNSRVYDPQTATTSTRTLFSMYR